MVENTPFLNGYRLSWLGVSLTITLKRVFLRPLQKKTLGIFVFPSMDAQWQSEENLQFCLRSNFGPLHRLYKEEYQKSGVSFCSQGLEEPTYRVSGL